jgi:hypothetical protein
MIRVSEISMWTSSPRELSDACGPDGDGQCDGWEGHSACQCPCHAEGGRSTRPRQGPSERFCAGLAQDLRGGKVTPSDAVAAIRTFVGDGSHLPEPTAPERVAVTAWLRAAGAATPLRSDA